MIKPTFRAILVALSGAVALAAAPAELHLPLRDASAVKKVWGDVRSYAEPRTAWGRDEANAAHRRGSSVGAESNAIFDVGPIVAPATPLRVNVDTDRNLLALGQQAYVMVAVLDEKGAPIDDYAAEQCLIVDENDLGRELRWQDATTAKLAGRKIILRFSLRDARVFAVHTVAPPEDKPLERVEVRWSADRLGPWETTQLALRGRDAAGRLLKLDDARVEFITEPAGTPLHLRPDPRDPEWGQVSVPGPVAKAGTVAVRARVTLGGVTRESTPQKVQLRTELPPKLPAGPRQLFMRAKDITDPQGPVEFRANTLEYLSQLQGLPTTPTAMTVFNREINGRYHVWGSGREGGVLFRAETEDGVRFERVQPLKSTMPSQHLMTMAYNAHDDVYLAFERVVEPRPLRWRAHFSKDGTTFTPGPDESVYHDHDATNLIWDGAQRRYLALAVTYQKLAEPRRYPDNIGVEKTLGIGLRRVLSVRESKDGNRWIPNNNSHSRDPASYVDEKYLIPPDAEDPVDLEHYWFNAFRYDDRWVGIVLTYAPSPANIFDKYPYDRRPSKHGPHLGTEWWVSDDGVKWERPYRTTPATPDLRIYFNHAPLVRNNRLVFLTSNQIYNNVPAENAPPRHGAPDGTPMEAYSLPVDRIASAGSVASASFASRPFKMPAGGLFLNYEHDGSLAVELLDEQGRVLRGYGRADGQLPKGSALAAPLRWSKRDGSELAGRTVRVRFHTTNARVYALGQE